VLSRSPVHLLPGVGRPLTIGGAEVFSAFMRLLLALTAASAAIAGGFDTPEDAVQALEQAYIQKNADSAVAVMDFVEEGRQMLQKINPTLANDPAMIKQAAEGRELAFRNELRTKGFPEFNHQKCSFVGKIQIAPGLVELTQQCMSPDGAKSVQDLLVVKSEHGWRVTLRPPP
jgi:hypothetical protein